MKKQIIAIILSLAMASSSVGAVPAYAAETTAEEAVAEHEESSETQEEVKETIEDSDSETVDKDILEEPAQPEEEPVQENETVDDADMTDEQDEIADTASTTEGAEEVEEELTESVNKGDAAAEIAEIEEPEVIEEEIVTADANEAANAEDVVDSGKCGDNATWTLTGTGDNLTLTISGSGYMNDFSESNIPWASKRAKIKSVIVEDGITGIGSCAFYYLTKLAEVTLSDTVTRFGRNVFSNCSSLNSLTIPNGVTNLYGAFENCSNLTNISIPDGVTNISYAFKNCSSLTRITLPNSVTNINSAFSGCSNLISITIPDGVTSINGTFSGCSSLTSITIPDGVTNIDGAFSGCSSLEEITIPDSVTYIGNKTFYKCSNLTSITIPDGVPIIGDSVFYCCSSLTSISIPDSVTSIGSHAFYKCSGLSSVMISDGVTSIGDFCFSSCSSLTNLIIPDSVTKIGRYVFTGCSSLNSVTIPDSVTKIGAYAFGNNKWVIKATIRFRGTKEQWDSAVGKNDVRFKSIVYNCFNVPADFTLSDTAFAYTGKAIKPMVTVSYKGNSLEEGVDYRIEYNNNINTGIATAKFTGIGKYSGIETLEYKILPVKTTRGDMFNLANNVKVTWKAVPGAKYYKVYREGITSSKETQKEPVIITKELVGWDKMPGLTNGHAYRYRIVASLTGKGDSSGDSKQSYSKVMYRLKTVAINSAMNTSPGKVTVTYNETASGDSYVLQYCERQDMVGAKTKVVMGAKNTSYVIGGLKKGKTYYISIRVRKKVNGVYYYTTFGVPKKVTITK